MALAMGKNQTITGEIKIIMEEVVKDIRKKFNNEIIPVWRMEFVMESLEKWIESAISAAFVLKEKT
jgi:preprotein translocase subunit SecA